MTIQIARKFGNALGIRSATRIKIIDEAMREYIRAVPQSAVVVAATGNIDAGQVVSGTFADARIAASNVEQFFTTTQSTVGAAGGASALPATPTGYVIFNVNGTDRAIPFYAES